LDISLADIKKVASELKGVIKPTELILSSTFSQMTGNKIYLKAEHLQKTGSFKIRGAYNKINNLSSAEKKRGVIASSAGNHAQGVAYAASENGIKATIVMPRGAPIAKVEATKNYGAQVVLAGEDYDAAYQKALELQQEKGYTFIHPFDDLATITGQATIGLEIINQLPDVDIIIVPIGGGGLISGISEAVKKLKSEVKVFGVEAENVASMKQSITKNKVVNLKSARTIADGIAVKSPGELTYQFAKENVDRFLTVSEEEIANAILLLLERTKFVVEGSGATPVAALLGDEFKGIKDKNIALVLSGGNIDFNMVARIIERGLVKAGRKIRVRTRLKDKPGSLQHLLEKLAQLEANVISIQHNRYNTNLEFDQAEVELELETKNNQHVQEIWQKLEEAGFVIE